MNSIFKLNKYRNEEGFTLIELLVVIVIIGILAAIALPIFLNQQKAATAASVKSDAKNTVSAAQTALTKKPSATGLVLDGSGLTPATGEITVKGVVSEGNIVTITNIDASGNGRWDGYVVHAKNTATGYWYEFNSTTGKYSDPDKGATPKVPNAATVPNKVASTTITGGSGAPVAAHPGSLAIPTPCMTAAAAAAAYVEQSYSNDMDARYVQVAYSTSTNTPASELAYQKTLDDKAAAAYNAMNSADTTSLGKWASTAGTITFPSTVNPSTLDAFHKELIAQACA